jgi:hypothetical protein
MSSQHQFLGFQFFMVGTLAWIAAALFAILDPLVVVKTEGPKAPEYAPNVAAAGAAFGFGVGGGLCFLGAALLYGKERGKAFDPPGPAEPGVAPDCKDFTGSRGSTAL